MANQASVAVQPQWKLRLLAFTKAFLPRSLWADAQEKAVPTLVAYFDRKRKERKIFRPRNLEGSLLGIQGRWFANPGEPSSAAPLPLPPNPGRPSLPVKTRAPETICSSRKDFMVKLVTQEREVILGWD